MIENNKLIAEFMGWKAHPEHGENYLINKNKDRKIPYWCNYNMEIPLDELNYTQSWDWLMPVVEKIESMGYDTLIKYCGDEYSNFVEILNTDEDPLQITCMVAHVDENSKLELTYLAVIEFIKWYNKIINNVK